MMPGTSSVLLERPSLVIDCSSDSVFVGLLGGDREWLSQSESKRSPLEGLFPLVKEVLRSGQLQISEVRNFVYCEGPGSVLGLRLCSMAIQTWGYLLSPNVSYFSYNSLELMAALVILDNPNINRGLLISDWKKDRWNSILIREGRAGKVLSIENKIINDWREGPLFYLPQRKGWQKIPEHAVALDYAARCLPMAMQLLRETKKIELYAANMNVFQKWVPQRHRAHD